MTHRTHVFEFLTHDELKLCLCIVMATKAEESRGSYPIGRYATPGEEGATNDWTELVLRAIRYLAFEHGLKYRGIVPHKDGRVTAERPIEPDNDRYVVAFKTGAFPDFDILLPQAIKWAGEKVPTLYLEPLRSLLADVNQQIEDMVAAADPEAMRELIAMRQEAVAQAKAWLREQSKQFVN